METTTIRVTPAIAMQWLKFNTINRPVRRSAVDGLTAAMKRGEYRLTHQGIAFAESGELLDGQHRLMAISQMPPDFGIDMQVTRGLNKSAFVAIDKGVKRSHGDSLGIPTAHAAVARFIAKTHLTAKESISTDYLIPFVSATAEPYKRLQGICQRTSRVWSSAAVRSAAILRMMGGGDFDYIGISYHALNHDDFESMSPIIQALYRQQIRGLVNGPNDLFLRAWKAFDHESQRLDKIQINEAASILHSVRAIILSEILGVKRGPAAIKRAVRKAEAMA
jgi:hypothetical protein